MTVVRIEVCVDSLAGLQQAIAGGADRIELCARLDQDGLTPTADLLAHVEGLRVPVRAMIRPSPGAFTVSDHTMAQMQEQIAQCRAAGCEGVVFGVLDAEGALDKAAMEALCLAASGMGKTLHRAVDHLPDPEVAVPIAKSLGIDTILSSGGADTAVLGARKLAQMAAQADGVTIMPGAGISAQNALAIAQETGALWVHGSFKGASGQTDASEIAQARANLQRA